MILELISYGLLGLGLLAALIDIMPQLNDWQKRIRIGRYDGLSDWSREITARGVKWLERTPKIKVTDNTRLVFLDMIRGNYSKDAIQHWQQAALLLGLAEYLKDNDDQDVKSAFQNFLNRNFDNNGQWKTKPEHVDAVILAYALMKLEFIAADTYKPALDYCWQLIKEHIGEDGTVQYRKYMSRYRYVDTIGFICPFLVSYGYKYNKPECIELAVKQIREYEKYGMSATHFIPCHAYKLEDKAPLGLYGWGRGLGWFAIGLIDSWNELPRNHAYKSVLEQIVVKFTQAVLDCQQANGSWNWTVTRSESRHDSSAAATLSWFLVNAAQIEPLTKPCLEGVNKAIGYLRQVTRRDGAIDFSQGDTKDIGVYSVQFNILPFSQGFGIRMSERYKKLTGQEAVDQHGASRQVLT
ncbi:glycoside hydrolase family 88 protein [Paenibacillus sp. N4]|uniref:glycoside hydrolase family 88 protein n=1 Tax=Paenibacillus vietnamensis TaxID=2590547 RepID=UPI001CD14FDE|nr:glycoside hydrolase family 88 protein [Paenibacillus vietnamensis]MCA0755379.1 glycoside hydrolase family 88 protein [Paenibacillus vietnamensis]